MKYILILLLLTGCVSNKWHGVLEKKDVDIDKPHIQLLTPWGQQVIEADHIRTRLQGSKNPITEPLK